MKELRVVQVDTDPHQRLRELILPRFQVDVYHPVQGDLALWGYACTIPGCQGHDVWGEHRICYGHRYRLQYLKEKTHRTHAPDFTIQQYLDPIRKEGPVYAR